MGGFIRHPQAQERLASRLQRLGITDRDTAVVSHFCEFHQFGPGNSHEDKISEISITWMNSESRHSRLKTTVRYRPPASSMILVETAAGIPPPGELAPGKPRSQTAETTDASPRNTSAAPPNLARLLREVEAGRELAITRKAAGLNARTNAVTLRDHPMAGSARPSWREGSPGWRFSPCTIRRKASSFSLINRDFSRALPCPREGWRRGRFHREPVSGLS